MWHLAEASISAENTAVGYALLNLVERYFLLY
jgi:hypothetical protein